MILKLTAPSHWASYLVNGDASGLALKEKALCDAWLKAEGVASILDAEDYGFCWRHDAIDYSMAADCQNYTCEVNE